MLTRRSLLMGSAVGIAAPPSAPLNILLITADDLNWSTVGAFGGRVKGLTPNMDKLAAQGMRFDRGHVTIAVCQPSRSAIMTGRYPHRNGAEGFGPIREEVPTLGEQLRKAGYFNGILAKNSHLAPRSRFCWDTYIEPGELGDGRNPQAYYRRTRAFLEQAKTAKRPFLLMANSQDPHRPFAGSDQELKHYGRALDFTRKIEPSEVTVPGFLPDIPEVRREVAEYSTSVHRCDQTVGEVLRALSESGMEQNTLVMFLSDNGMAFPFAKTNCYLNSTRTPWIVRWPGVTKPGSVDRRHYISGIDFTPTVLEAAGLPRIPDIDGRSFVPVLKGGRQDGRDSLVTVFHETSARRRFDMRCIHDGHWGYIWNAWSDGKTIFRNESQNGRAYPAMRASEDPAIAARTDFFLKRVPEELYDFQNDPDALRNRVKEEPRVAHRLRAGLADWMKRTGDPLAPRFGKMLG